MACAATGAAALTALTTALVVALAAAFATTLTAALAATALASAALASAALAATLAALASASGLIHGVCPVTLGHRRSFLDGKGRYVPSVPDRCPLMPTANTRKFNGGQPCSKTASRTSSG